MAPRRVRRRFDVNLRRRPAYREPKKRFMLVCEGKRTEPDYFGYFNRLRFSEVKVTTEPASGTPGPIVRRAIELRKGEYCGEDDDVWAVFDVDQHSDLGSALNQANANGISVALSSPCFELWLLLHFRHQSADIHRRKAYHETKQHLPRYEKGITEQHFVLLADRYETAAMSAVRLVATATADGSCDPWRNPQTSAHVLVGAILDSMLKFEGGGVGQSLKTSDASGIVGALRKMMSARKRRH